MTLAFQLHMKLQAYYVVETQWICNSCGSNAGSHTSNKIQCLFQTDNGKQEVLSFRSLIERFERIYNVTYEEASKRIPRAKLQTFVVHQNVEFCKDCMPSAMGGMVEEDRMFPPFLPNMIAKTQGMNHSNILHEEEQKLKAEQEARKKRKKSRSIHPKEKKVFTLDDL